MHTYKKLTVWNLQPGHRINIAPLRQYATHTLDAEAVAISEEVPATVLESASSSTEKQFVRTDQFDFVARTDTAVEVLVE